jgi:hypothetical protein
MADCPQLKRVLPHRTGPFFSNEGEQIMNLRHFSPLLFALLVAQGMAQPVVFTGYLNGAVEVPPNVSAGVGDTTVTLDATANTMRLVVSFTGLTGNTTAAHIHCCTTTALTGTASVATTTPTFAGFPLGVPAGTYDTTFDMTQIGSYNAPFVTVNGGTAAMAQAALFAGIAAGKAYLNLHSSAFGGSEIRSFLVLNPWSMAAF